MNSVTRTIILFGVVIALAGLHFYLNTDHKVGASGASVQRTPPKPRMRIGTGNQVSLSNEEDHSIRVRPSEFGTTQLIVEPGSIGEKFEIASGEVEGIVEIIYEYNGGDQAIEVASSVEKKRIFYDPTGVPATRSINVPAESKLTIEIISVEPPLLEPSDDSMSTGLRLDNQEPSR